MIARTLVGGRHTGHVSVATDFTRLTAKALRIAQRAITSLIPGARRPVRQGFLDTTAGDRVAAIIQLTIQFGATALTTALVGITLFSTLADHLRTDDTGTAGTGVACGAFVAIITGQIVILANAFIACDVTGIGSAPIPIVTTTGVVGALTKIDFSGVDAGIIHRTSITVAAFGPQLAGAQVISCALLVLATIASVIATFVIIAAKAILAVYGLAGVVAATVFAIFCRVTNALAVAATIISRAVSRPSLQGAAVFASTGNVASIVSTLGWRAGRTVAGVGLAGFIAGANITI